MDPKYIQKLKDMMNSAESGDWNGALSHAELLHERKIPNTLEQLAYTEGGVPPFHLDRVLDMVKNHPHEKESIVHALSDNLHENADPKSLNRLFSMAPEDYLVSENIKNHPNFQSSIDPSKLKASDFWNSYEKKVEPSHFAAIKSFLSGEDHSIETHRGDVGHSAEHSEHIPHLFQHMQTSQNAVMNDPDIKKHYINGEPHVKVYRGVGGEYAKAIKDSSGLTDHEVDDYLEGGMSPVGTTKETRIGKHKTLKIPSAHMASWTTDEDVARRFAVHRGGHGLDNESHHVVVSKTIPVSHILHTGSHTLFPGHEPVHHSEKELVVAHPEGNYTASTKNMQIGHAAISTQIKWNKPVKEEKDMNKSDTTPEHYITEHPTEPTMRVMHHTESGDLYDLNRKEAVEAKESGIPHIPFHTLPQEHKDHINKQKLPPDQFRKKTLRVAGTQQETSPVEQRSANMQFLRDKISNAKTPNYSPGHGIKILRAVTKKLRGEEE